MSQPGFSFKSDFLATKCCVLDIMTEVRENHSIINEIINEIDATGQKIVKLSRTVGNGIILHGFFTISNRFDYVCYTSSRVTLSLV